MGEPEGREDEPGATEASAVPEGAAASDGPPADPAHGDELPAFRAKSKSAGDMSLDLAAALDEPEQLVRMLGFAANEHVGYSENSTKWAVVLKHSLAAGRELAQMNEPASHRGAKTPPS